MVVMSYLSLENKLVLESKYLMKKVAKLEELVQSQVYR
jgi:hypothetical protein